MKRYDFDEIIRREDTGSVKYDRRKQMFGTGNVIPLWIADMDFRTPDFVVDAVRKRAEHEIYGYSFVPDTFYESVQGWMMRRHGWDIRQEWIVHCPGVVPSLVLSVLALTQPEEAVVVQPPVYHPFFSVIRNNGRRVVENPLELHNGRWSVNFGHLRQCLERRAKLLFLCSPHNPGGTVWRQDELERIGDICRNHDAIVVSDEIHSDLIFHGYKHLPAASVSDEASQNTITLMSPSKTFNISGLTSSVAVIPNSDKRRQFLQTLHRLHWTTPNVFSLIAFEAAHRHGEGWLEQLIAYLGKNLDFLINFFHSEIPRIKVIRPEGTYLAWLDCRNLDISRTELNDLLIGRAKVGLSDGALFGTGGEGFMRLNFACPFPVLREALERIKQAVNHHR